MKTVVTSCRIDHRYHERRTGKGKPYIYLLLWHNVGITAVKCIENRRCSEKYSWRRVVNWYFTNIRYFPSMHIVSCFCCSQKYSSWWIHVNYLPILSSDMDETHLHQTTANTTKWEPCAMHRAKSYFLCAYVFIHPHSKHSIGPFFYPTSRLSPFEGLWSRGKRER